MQLILKFQNNNINYEFGCLDIAKPDTNLGLTITMDPGAISSFLSNTGTLNSVKYPQSDKSKFISFYLDNKILSLPLTITAPNQEILDTAKLALDSIINKNSITEFEVDKYLEINGVMTLKASYRFYGVFKKTIYTEFGNTGYKLFVEIEMTEPRFDKINRDDNGDIIANRQSIIMSQEGFKFPVKFPIKFGSQSNQLKINNNGNASVTPIVEFKNAGSEWKIITQKGLFFYSQTLFTGQNLILDVENQSAKINGLEKNAYCSGWENLILDVGINVWKFQVLNIQQDTEIIVKYFEKYHSL